MKKVALLALMFCFSLPANAAVITYTYADEIANPDANHDAFGVFRVDSVRRGLISSQFVSEPATFNWEGFSPLMYDQPVSDEDQLYENGFEPFTVGDLSCFLFLDLFGLEAGEDIFDNLHKTFPNEGATISNLLSGEEFYLTGRLTKVQAVAVPEPSTLALLALGLLGFATRQRFTG